MSIADIIVPAYRGLQGSFQGALIQMIQRSQCRCGTHEPWKCDRGLHSLYMRPHVEGCVVHWSRNHLVCQFMYESSQPGRPPADYCLMLDDDILVEPYYLERMLMHKKDIVVGICTKRRHPAMPTIRQWNAEEGKFVEIVEWKWDSQKIFEIDGSGAACMLVHRRVLERMAEAYLEAFFERLEDRPWKSEMRRKHYEQAKAEGQTDRMNCWWFQFGWDPSGNERGELGEDMTFSWRAKQLGFKIYADPQITPGHLGPYAYSVHDYKFYREQQKLTGLQHASETDGTEPQLHAASKT